MKVIYYLLGFKRFVQELNPNYVMHNHHTISKELILACLGEIKKLVSCVESACLTTDCWTSSNNKSSLTIHFINNPFVLNSILLSCLSFSSNHTVLYLGTEIRQVLESWTSLIK